MVEIQAENLEFGSPNVGRHLGKAILLRQNVHKLHRFLLPNIAQPAESRVVSGSPKERWMF